jgi:hypothetical protein
MLMNFTNAINKLKRSLMQNISVLPSQLIIDVGMDKLASAMRIGYKTFCFNNPEIENINFGNTNGLSQNLFDWITNLEKNLPHLRRIPLKPFARKKLTLIFDTMPNDNVTGLFQYMSDALLFDELKMLDYREIVSKQINMTKVGFLIIRDEESYFLNTEKGCKSYLMVNCHLLTHAIDKFVASKYGLRSSNSSLNELLEKHLSQNPNIVGKKKVKYTLQTKDKNLELDFFEVAEAIRPYLYILAKELEEVLKGVSYQNVFVLTDIGYMRALFATYYKYTWNKNWDILSKNYFINSLLKQNDK